MFSTLPLFAVLDINHTLYETGYHIVVNTNTPCHLYMRETKTKPQEHFIARWRRGLQIRDDKYFCFVAYEDNEQLEVGDTLRHTFIKPDWPICETRWFYFVGTIDDIPSPSTSPIFKLHKEHEAPSEVNFHEYQGVDYYHNAVFKKYWYAETFISPADYLLSKIDLKLMRGGLFNATVTMGIRATFEDHPAGVDLTTQEIPLSTISLEEGGDWATFQLYIPIKLYKNTLYSIVLRCLDSPVATALIWGHDYTGFPPSGQYWRSLDWGLTWESQAVYLYHKCYGVPR